MPHCLALPEAHTQDAVQGVKSLLRDAVLIQTGDVEAVQNVGIPPYQEWVKEVIVFYYLYMFTKYVYVWYLSVKHRKPECVHYVCSDCIGVLWQVACTSTIIEYVYIMEWMLAW